MKLCPHSCTRATYAMSEVVTSEEWAHSFVAEFFWEPVGIAHGIVALSIRHFPAMTSCGMWVDHARVPRVFKNDTRHPETQNLSEYKTLATERLGELICSSAVAVSH